MKLINYISNFPIGDYLHMQSYLISTKRYTSLLFIIIIIIIIIIIRYYSAFVGFFKIGLHKSKCTYTDNLRQKLNKIE